MIDQIRHSKPYADKEDEDAVVNQIASLMHGTGARVEEFEQKMRELIGRRYSRATTSGTTALHISLLALGVGEGDEIIIPSYVCQSVMNAVNYTRAKPILVDIDDSENKGYNISVKTIKTKVTKRTKAIIVPHMFGFPAEIDKIKKEFPSVKVIEDCAQSLGGRYKEKMLGGFGDLSIFSFYATKMISTGHGGMILTDSEEIKKRIDDLMKYDKRDGCKL